MTTEKKDKGTQLEWIFANYLKIIEPNAHPTPGSKHGDVTSTIFFPEMKNWNKKNVIVAKNLWDKLLKQLPIDSQRVPILVQSNNQGDIFVSIRIDDFFRKFVYPIYQKEE